MPRPAITMQTEGFATTWSHIRIRHEYRSRPLDEPLKHRIARRVRRPTKRAPPAPTADRIANRGRFKRSKKCFFLFKKNF
jgi:hypothetical protein